VQLAAVRAGLGVGVCQLPLAIRDPELERLVPALSGELELWVVSHQNLRGSPRVRACIDALARDLAAYASRFRTEEKP
jgi:DNA-binding transcriptional LysR family regulator